MEKFNYSDQIVTIDDRHEVIIPGGRIETIAFCIAQFIRLASHCIHQRGYFAVALSGGSTPEEIFRGLSGEINRYKVDWERVILFWSDERSVPPDAKESNYRMAMDAGFSTLPIPEDNIFRMKAEEEPERNAKLYEKLINEKLSGAPLDFVMLGVGQDGHTASLFPKTHALHTSEDRLVVENFVPKIDTWRMTMTYTCINAARNVAIYALGAGKAEILEKVLSQPFDPDTYPIQGVGTPENKALFIVDEDAAVRLKKSSGFPHSNA